jgi:hypothetical protein
LEKTPLDLVFKNCLDNFKSYIFTDEVPSLLENLASVGGNHLEQFHANRGRSYCRQTVGKWYLHIFKKSFFNIFLKKNWLDKVSQTLICRAVQTPASSSTYVESLQKQYDNITSPNQQPWRGEKPTLEKREHIAQDCCTVQTPLSATCSETFSRTLHLNTQVKKQDIFSIFVQGEFEPSKPI